jgi:UDP-3-O-[3-hydroxymyristoyl] glucosamine N-acyltransferase
VSVVTRTVAELAKALGAELEGDGSLVITGVAGLEEAQPGQLSFYGNPKYKAALGATKASAVLVPRDATGRGQATWLRVGSPHLAYARASQLFSPPRAHAPGIAAGAHVHATAQVDDTATVMVGATVDEGASIGPRAVLYPGVYVGQLARVGADSVLKANVVVADGCLVGARCLLHPGVVIGADGFGFALDLEKPEHVKIPQVGIARLEDDVEIGAASCVDRATTGETVIGRGTKIDNLVQVGHNCTVGAMSILCAQVGLAGTTELGMGVMLGGQVGIAGHVRIGDMAKVIAQSGIMRDLDAGAIVGGSPAIPQREWMRSTALFARLPELQHELTQLKKRLEALEKKDQTP